MKPLILSLLAMSSFIAANSQPVGKKESSIQKSSSASGNSLDVSGNYNFNSPDKNWQMPPELREISGISFNKEGKLLCEQDQKGHIYVYNLNSSTVEKVIRFSNKADFEDIAFANDTVFVLRSDGVIFCVADYLSAAPVTTQIGTFLNAENNTEGLCYDSENNRLLVACKRNSGMPAGDKGSKAIYALSLTDHKMHPTPVFVITKKEMKDIFGDKIEIDPSAIAINPISKNIFIIGTKDAKVLTELSAEGKLIQVIKLTNPLFIQPEGIAFDKNGDMYISNEGRDRSGNILLFKYKK